MRIIKKIAWKNQRCAECGKKIGFECPYYEIRVGFASDRAWRLCIKCCEKLFKKGVLNEIR